MTTSDPGLLLPDDRPFTVNAPMLKLLVEATLPWTVSVIVTDLNGIVTHWNNFAEVIYGWTAAEAVGTPIAELTVGPVTQETADDIMDHLRAGRHWSGAFEARRRDGDLIAIHILNAPVVDEHGVPVAIVGISREASDQLERSLVELAEMRDMAGHLDEVRRTEARRISAQIHDEFSQRFHVLIQRTAALAADDQVPESCRDELNELMALQQELVGVMHGVCGSLRPPLLDELGVEVALEHLVESIQQLGLHTTADIDPALVQLDPAIGEVVLAIAQEALSNVVAHANASVCRVQAVVRDGVLELTVSDDGDGWGQKWGFGLRLMNERTRRCGGTLSMGAADGGGTVVSVRLPVSAG
jgi:PAS domain S-box-containing protein